MQFPGQIPCWEDFSCLPGHHHELRKVLLNHMQILQKFLFKENGYAICKYQNH
jgi:hypothetical protein